MRQILETKTVNKSNWAAASICQVSYLKPAICSKVNEDRESRRHRVAGGLIGSLGKLEIPHFLVTDAGQCRDRPLGVEGWGWGDVL